MNKKRVEIFVKKCNKGIGVAKEEIQKLSEDEIIELKAILKAEVLFFNKWDGIFIPTFSLILVLLSISGVAEMLRWLEGLVMFFLVVIAMILIFCCFEQLKKKSWIIALNLLEEYVENNSKVH